jgi:hypothetical protein
MKANGHSEFSSYVGQPDFTTTSQAQCVLGVYSRIAVIAFLGAINPQNWKPVNGYTSQLARHRPSHLLLNSNTDLSKVTLSPSCKKEKGT